MHLKLIQKILLGPLLGGLFLLVAAAYAYLASNANLERLDRIEKIRFEVLVKSDANRALLEQLRSAMVSAAAAAEMAFVEDADGFKDKIVQNLDDIVRADPDKRDEVVQVRRAFDAYYIAAREVAQGAASGKGMDASKVGALVGLIKIADEVMAHFRKTNYDEFVSDLGATKRSIDTTLKLGLALSLLALAVILVASTGLARKIVANVQNVVVTLRDLSAGKADLTKRLQSDTRDEIGELVDNFNVFSGKLEQDYALLESKTNDIAAMLGNMEQGILTIIPGNTVHPEYSKYLETIVGTTDIAGANATDLLLKNTNLGADALDSAVVAISACVGEDRMNFEFNAHLFPLECEKTTDDGKLKSLDFSWTPICDEQDVVQKLMVIVRDVTELKRLTAEANSQKRELEMIGQVLAINQEKFHEFMDSSRAFVIENETLIRQHAAKDAATVGLLFRNMHTIKGNARTYGLTHLTNSVHEAEQVYDDLRSSDAAVWDAPAMLGHLAGIKGLLDEYQVVNDQKLGRKGPGRRGSVEKYLMVEKDRIDATVSKLLTVNMLDLHALRSAVEHASETLALIGTETVYDVLASILTSLPSLANELGKVAPHISINDNGIVIRNQATGLVKNLFMHLYRNSMDHGIEGPEDRVQSGKAAAGKIALDVAMEEGYVVFRLSDDGRGLAISRIRQNAIDKGLIDANASLTPSEIAKLIFMPGFSTAEKVTEISGRGVGMDAVRGFLEREHGQIELVLKSEQSGVDFLPFETVVRLPERLAFRKSAQAQVSGPG